MRILEPATMLGLGAVALWLYVRFPRLRPKTLLRAGLHLFVSIGLFIALPHVMHTVFALLPAPASAVAFVVFLLMPTLCYVLLSWVWFIARIHDMLDSTPRGGHPASDARA